MTPDNAAGIRATVAAVEALPLSQSESGRIERRISNGTATNADAALLFQELGRMRSERPSASAMLVPNYSPDPLHTTVDDRLRIFAGHFHASAANVARYAPQARLLVSDIGAITERTEALQARYTNARRQIHDAVKILRGEK